MTSGAETQPAGRSRALLLISLAELLGMAVWFSASASVPALQSEWGLGEGGAAWLTLAVQFGFVAGTLASALANLPDVMPVKRLFAASTILAACANVAIAAPSAGPRTALVLRFATGFFLAGVYPPGMKLMASWYRRGRGMAIGVLVGALTVGKASPYLINAVGSQDWRVNTLAVSLAAATGAVIVGFFVAEGPFAPAAAPFDIHQARKILCDPALRLANSGYFGHMWELYAMWTWVPVMIRSSFSISGAPPRLAEAASFLVLGAGAVGCVAAGILADRVGRTTVTSGAMLASGACCLTIGFLHGGSPTLLVVVAAFWGAAVVADSAQFSACITELCEPRYVGTALTLQTCIGFLLTTVSVRLLPLLESGVGWRWAFLSLAPGPILGTVAMLRLRANPRAVGIAHGLR